MTPEQARQKMAEMDKKPQSEWTWGDVIDYENLREIAEMIAIPAPPRARSWMRQIVDRKEKEMNAEEMLRQLEFEYWAEVAAQCQDDFMPNLIDLAKVEASPRLRTFEDYLKARGYKPRMKLGWIVESALEIIE